MRKEQIVKDFISSIEQSRFEQIDKYITEDFTFSGPVPKPIKKQEWLALHKNLAKGLPDIKFNLNQCSESGNVVNCNVQLSGTHTKEMPSLMPGVPPVPATNTKVQLPKENIVFTFRGDRIAAMTVEKLPNGGVPGLLRQLGVTVPLKTQ